jgi:hypothetical protein
MLCEKVELPLLPALAFEQLADRPQTVGPVGQRHPAGFLQIGDCSISRLTPRRRVISRLECAVVWRVRILSISAIVSRFAIQDLLQQGFAEG